MFSCPWHPYGIPMARVRRVVDVTVLGLVGGAPGGETPRVADSSAAGAGRSGQTHSSSSSMSRHARLLLPDSCCLLHRSRTRPTQVARRHDWLRSTVSYQQALTRGRVVIPYRLHEFERELLHLNGSCALHLKGSSGTAACASSGSSPRCRRSASRREKSRSPPAV